MALWTGPQILVAQLVRPGPCGDLSGLGPWRPWPILSFEQLVADAGYDSEANHCFCREGLGVDSLISVRKRRSAAVVATTPSARRCCTDPTDGGGRRKPSREAWDDALSARLEAIQRVQALLRGVIYNRWRFVAFGAQL